ncbi:MAG: glucose-6-phosphate isomerase [Sphingomonadaceae bacterium]|nr:glucose-6-phosphate isomerase [Sphingomonadaceae bacterium]
MSGRGELKAWQALRAAAAAPIDLATTVAQDAGRRAALIHALAGIYFDFSKLAVPAGALQDLAALADAVGFDAARAALFAGEVVNRSENRAATHPAERGGAPAAVARAVSDGQMRLRTVAAVLRDDPGVRDVIHIGIGGSALGPALLLDALGYHGDGPRVHVVANIDGVALERALAACDPGATRVIVVSKTFTTLETMTNAASALDWLAAGGVDNPRGRCIAVTAAPDRAAAWGVAAADILPFAETVGGRYSLWSAVGLPLAIRCGVAAFDALQAGAAAVDAHFASAPFAANVPALAGALDVWAATFMGRATRSVFAYDERLRLLPAFLQQLEMESNGKRVSADGGPVDYPTAAITWGGTGTDAQHAVFQLLHQGTHADPVEFVAVREPGHALAAAHHRQLLGNAFAQGAALLRGRSFDEALALANGDRRIAAARTFPGNRPSATILLDRLDPATLGALLAFYEHRTFTAATLLGINPFDQWGVELGKEMANALDGGGSFDPSTAALIARAGL